MKQAYLLISTDGDAELCDIDVAGFGSIAQGTECRARRAGHRLRSHGPWILVRIGEKVDHVGSRTNSRGAVYACEVIRTIPVTKGIDAGDTGNLFGGGA